MDALRQRPQSDRLFSDCLYGVTAGTCNDLTPMPIYRQSRAQRRSARYLLPGAAHPQEAPRSPLARFLFTRPSAFWPEPFWLIAFAASRPAPSRDPLCVPKTSSELMMRRNRLSCWNDRAALFRSGRPVRLNSMTYKTTDGSGRTHGDGAPKGDS